MPRLMQIGLAGVAGAVLVGFLARSRWGQDAVLYGAVGGLALGVLLTSGPLLPTTTPVAVMDADRF